MDRAVEEIDRPGGILHVREQFVLGNAGEALLLALLQPVVEGFIAQPHDDDQLLGLKQRGRRRCDHRLVKRRARLRRLEPIVLLEQVFVDHVPVGVEEPKGDRGDEIRMPDLLDELKGLELLAAFSAAEPDYLDGDLGPARRGCLPDLPKPSPAEDREQAVPGPGDRFTTGRELLRHGSLLRKICTVSPAQPERSIRAGGWHSRSRRKGLRRAGPGA